MGCGNQKCVFKHKKNFGVVLCNNPKIDELFDPARTRIVALKSLLKDIKYSESSLKHITFTHIIKNSSLKDCIMSLLLLLVSSSENAIQYFELKFIPIFPYLSLNKTNLTLEQNSILEVWGSLIKTLIESQQKLQKLEIEFKNIIKDLPFTESTCKGICNNTEMDTHEAANILKTTMLNLSIVYGIPQLITKNLETINGMNEICYRLYREFNQGKLDQILKIGDEIRKNRVQGIKNIILGYWPEKERIDLSLEGIKRIKIDYKIQS